MCVHLEALIWQSARNTCSDKPAVRYERQIRKSATNWKRKKVQHLAVKERFFSGAGGDQNKTKRRIILNNTEILNWSPETHQVNDKVT